MRLSVDEIKALANSVASEVSRSVSVTAVSMTRGDSDRTEVLVTLEGCHADPCRVMVNVSRVGSETFALEFGSKLRAAISKHF